MRIERINESGRNPLPSYQAREFVICLILNAQMPTLEIDAQPYLMGIQENSEGKSAFTAFLILRKPARTGK